MKYFVLAVVAIVCTSFAVAEEDALDLAITHCLKELNLNVEKVLNEEESACFIGCIMKKFNMIDENGKLLDGGIENFVNGLPKPAFELLPNVLEDLTKLKPELEKATSACDAGRIALPALSELFITEPSAEE